MGSGRSASHNSRVAANSPPSFLEDSLLASRTFFSESSTHSKASLVWNSEDVISPTLFQKPGGFRAFSQKTAQYNQNHAWLGTGRGARGDATAQSLWIWSGVMSSTFYLIAMRRRSRSGWMIILVSNSSAVIARRRTLKRPPNRRQKPSRSLIVGTCSRTYKRPSRGAVRARS